MRLIKKREYIFKIMAISVAFILLFSQIKPQEALASRSKSGGGDMGEFSWGSFAMSAGMSVGSTIIGGVLSSGLKGAWNSVTGSSTGAADFLKMPLATGSASTITTTGGISSKFFDLFPNAGNTLITTGGNVSNFFNLPLSSYGAISTVASAATSASPGFLSSIGNYFSSLSSLKNVAPIAVAGFTTLTAVSEAGSAVRAIGAYYDWKPSSVFLVSNVVSGAVGGFLNPSTAFGEVGEPILKGITKDVAAKFGAPITDSAIKTIAETTFETSGYNMVKGAFIGSLKNFAEAGVIVAIDGGRINEGKQPGALAQIGGLWAGVAAGNFARALVNPATWNEQSLGMYEKDENPYLESQKYYQEGIKEIREAKKFLLRDKNNIFDDKFIDKLASANEKFSAANKYAAKAQKLMEHFDEKGKELFKKEEFIWYKLESANPLTDESRPYLDSEMRAMFGPQYPEIELRGEGEGVFKVVDTKAQIGASQIGRRLFEATFIKTADMWPQLATRSLSIVASNAFRENRNGLSSFVSSAVQGIAAPLFSGLADTFALRPGLYVGENRLANSFEYSSNMKQQLARYKMDKIGAEFYEAYAQNKDNPDALKNKLQEIANDKYKLDIDILAITKRPELKEQMQKTLLETDINKEEKEKLLDAALERPFNSASATLGLAISQARVKIEADIKKLETLDKVFESVGTDRFALAFKSATSGLKFGLIEGAVHGGTDFLTSKFSEKNDLFVAAAASYGATMLTGAIRGIIWKATWKPSIQDGEMVWRNRKSEYMPEPYKGEDWLQAKISQYSYPRELEHFRTVQELLGLPIESKPTRELEGTTWVDKEAKGYELVTIADMPRFYKGTDTGLSAGPSLKQAILYSLERSNYTFLKRAFAFGIPQLRPQKINTLVMSDYFRQLNSYAMVGARPDWLVSGINSGSINASSFSISNNILTSLAAIKPVADTFNMQRQRITLTNAPFRPLMAQGLDYMPWALGVKTTWYLDEISARSRTGESFLREGK